MTISTIILDTNEYIFGLTGKDKDCARLLDQLSNFRVLIPRIILQELHNNLSGEMLNKLYKLLIKANIEIVDTKVPISFVKEFKTLLPFEDAIIAAYCKFFKVDYLISENRHFLVSFKVKAFRVLSADKFLKFVYKIRPS